MEKVESFEIVLMRDMKLFVFTNKGICLSSRFSNTHFSGAKQKFTQNISLEDVHAYGFLFFTFL